MKKLILNSVFLIALLVSGCGNSTDNSSGGKIISIRDQIGLTDSLGNGSSAQQKSKEEVIDVSSMSPLEQLKVMVEAAEKKNNILVNSFINYDSLDFFGFDSFDYVLFDDKIPSYYSNDKRNYLTKNSYKIIPGFLKSDLITANLKNKDNSIESVTILKNNNGEYRFGAYPNGTHQFFMNVSQDYPDGNGGGALMYRFYIGSDKRISLVQVLMAGGTVSF